jgi:hypothetical protein
VFQIGGDINSTVEMEAMGVEELVLLNDTCLGEDPRYRLR